MKTIEKNQSIILKGGKSCLELRLRAHGAWGDGNDRRAERFSRRADRRGCDSIKFPIDFGELEEY